MRRYDDFCSEFPLPKEESLLCGDACLRVIQKLYGLVPDDSPPGEKIWIADLAHAILQWGLHAVLFCRPDSLLYRDYCLANTQERESFEGFRALFLYEAAGGLLLQVALTVDRLSRHIQSGGIVLLLVDSRTWNNDPSMSGGHYVIAFHEHRGEYLIVNPKKDVIIIEKRGENDVLSAVEQGGWYLFISDVPASWYFRKGDSC